MESTKDILGTFGRLSNMTEIKQKSKDRLKPFIQYTMKIAIRKPVRIFMYAITGIHFFGLFISVYSFMVNFDGNKFFMYGSLCGVHFLICLAAGHLLIILDHYVEFLTKYGKSGFPIELMGEKDMKKILDIVKILKVISLLALFLAVMTSLGAILSPDYVNQRSFLCVWVKENFPDNSKWILAFIHWSILPACLVILAIAVCFLYGAFTGLFQILILQCMIADIPKSCIPKKYRRDSELYQNGLREKMIMVIKSHEYIVGYQTEFSYILEGPLATASLAILVVAISIMIEFICNSAQKVILPWQIVVGFISYAFSVMIYTTVFFGSGQLLKDATERCTYELCQLPWYDMDAKNKRIYSIFLYRSHRTLGVSNSILELDLYLLLRILSNIYSLAAIFRELTPPIQLN